MALGCGFGLLSGPDGPGIAVAPGALARRAARAAEAYHARARLGAPVLVVASGGRAWGGVVEADALAAELVRRGVPPEAILHERRSLSTLDNARFTAEALGRRGVRLVCVVTCAWHLPRAVVAFERTGLAVVGLGAPEGVAPVPRRIWRWGRERVLSAWLAWGLLLVAGCHGRSSGAPSEAGIDAGPAPLTVQARIARAEDTRRARDLPEGVTTSHDPALRRLAARASARILDADDAPLLRALDDDDAEVVAWAAYGLGESCRGKEAPHAQALAARLVSLDVAAAAGALDPRASILRALGRCGGDVAEQTLRAWVRRADAAPGTAEAAAYALGDVAARRGSLSIESTAALLDATRRTPAVDAALYAFGRSDSAGGEDVQPALLAAARAALGRPGVTRFFAVRALARAGADAADDLARVLSSTDFTAAERAEAAHALAKLHKAGQAALGPALAGLVPSSPSGLSGDAFGVLHAAVDAAGDDPPKALESALWSVTRIEAGPSPSAALARRVSQLRCGAAAKLARGAFDSDVLRGCDVGDGEAGEHARTVALDRGALTHARRAAWLDLVHSAHVRVMEAALEMIERHPELGDAALPVLAEALASGRAGVVATAADVVHGHPDRAFVLAASERRAALDPHAPPPTADPARELDARVARALKGALAHPWSEDLVETRVALLDAALAVGLEEGKTFAHAACQDANVTVRARAAKALAAAGDKDATCPAPTTSPPLAPEVDAPLASATRVSFDTDAGPLAITFDPVLTPVAATRFVALARSGFYTGVAVHRVVPGFVVQFGDRGADGYGGSGASLRCETSPVPFGPLDVGVALAGRDTGSSQVFVTLARHPHLDGGYAWVGRATGDWDAVAEGDVIRAVRVEP